MKQIVVFPRGQLSAKDKERLTKADILAVEADDPSKVVTVLPGAPLLSADDMLMSAMYALTARGDYSSAERSSMVMELHRRLQAKEAASKAEDATP